MGCPDLTTPSVILSGTWASIVWVANEEVAMNERICTRCYTPIAGEATGPCPACGGDEVVPVTSPRGQSIAAESAKRAKEPSRRATRNAWLALLVILGGGATVVHYASTRGLLAGPPVRISEVAILPSGDGHGYQLWLSVEDGSGAATRASGKLFITVLDSDPKVVCTEERMVSRDAWEHTTVGRGAFSRKVLLFATSLPAFCGGGSYGKEAHLQFETREAGTLYARERML
jgi:hypothetical protein